MSAPSRPTSPDLIEARRYRITAVLGKGGFGKVYRAVMEGAGGFTKDVAIKLLRDEDVPEVSLQRFRDEARILGLIRDRAIVNVDPPTRLAGKWAVVMEYVDGATVQRLMKLGPMPATVAAEIIQEVARALDKVYRAPGPNGEPLRLLHRDIKPANLQLTQDGEVKILDFGIARADFENREAVTQAYVGGTRGYIAPERLDGKEGPEGDVYSLGVTAHYMLTATRPTRRQLLGLDAIDTSAMDDDTRAMVDLATRMRSVVVEERPTAREVEEICSSILRTSKGISLRRWAEQNVPHAVANATDEMVGSVLTETLAGVPSGERLAGLIDFEPSESRRAPAPSSMGPMVVASLVTAIVALLLFAFVSFGGLASAGLWWAATTGAGPEAPAAADAPPLPSAPPTPGPSAAPAEGAAAERGAEPASPAGSAGDEPGGSPGGAADPASDAPTPAPADPQPVAPKPVAPAPQKPGSPPTPKPSAPASPDRGAPTAPAAKLYAVTLTSIPPGADVTVDGRKLGAGPISDLELTEGTHTVEMLGDAESTVFTITVGHRRPVRYVWTGGSSVKEFY